MACNNYEVIDLGVMVPAQKILDAAREHHAQVIGLSGLITPSLDEMVHVAKEMQRQGFSIPLLIGGATTSRMHTAVKIAPAYHGPVIHVLDASRSVPTLSKLLSVEDAAGFKETLAAETIALRDNYLARQEEKEILSPEEALKNRLQIDWHNSPIYTPKYLGVKVFENISYKTLIPYIDWTPFFSAWELHGKYPAILTDEVVGEQAQSLFKDAQEMLKELAANEKLGGKAVVGLFPAHSSGDEIHILSAMEGLQLPKCDCHYHSDVETLTLQAVLPTARQLRKKAKGQPNLSLSDFVAPDSSGRTDYIGAFAVTAGHGIEELAKEYEVDNNDYKAIMVKALADRLAEALAEYMHLQVRTKYWGYRLGACALLDAWQYAYRKWPQNGQERRQWLHSRRVDYRQSQIIGQGI
jgi:5-methyltetrahydrofolate--homocysteine methyltransferase